MPAFSIAKNLEVLGDDVRPKARRRLVELRETLKQRYNTILRDDSVLAWNYANECLPAGQWSFQDVVFQLLMTRYLYEFTNYELDVDQVIQDFRYMLPLNKETFRNWLLPLAQLRTLRKTGLPKTWPWLLRY